MWKIPTSLAGKYLRLRYRPEIRLENLEKALATGERVILTPHYASFLDPIMFGILTPGDPVVVISPTLAKRKLFARFAGSFKHVVIDMNDPFSLKQLDEIIEKNRFTIIFPEPEPTTSGLLSKLLDSVVAAALKSGAWIVPARACNTQFTSHSRMGSRLKCVRRPKITLIAGEPVKLGTADSGSGTKERRHSVLLELERIMENTMAEGIWDRMPLFDTILEQRRIWGGSHPVAREPDGSTISLNSLIVRIFAMQRIAESLSKEGERLGIMLPNTSMTLAAIIGVQHSDREPAMINYSMGSRALLSACGTAKVGTIMTSRRFVEEGKFQPLVDTLAENGIKIAYLEDMLSKMSVIRKIGLLFSAAFAKRTPDAEKYANRTAVVLFTSGSEGVPKAVALSHKNIQANTAQIRTTLGFWKTDTMMAVLPMFHSFGLSTGVFMPLSTGMTIAFYPTPLHYKKIPQ